MPLLHSPPPYSTRSIGAHTSPPAYRSLPIEPRTAPVLPDLFTATMDLTSLVIRAQSTKTKSTPWSCSVRNPLRYYLRSKEPLAPSDSDTSMSPAYSAPRKDPEPDCTIPPPLATRAVPQTFDILTCLFIAIPQKPQPNFIAHRPPPTAHPSCRCLFLLSYPSYFSPARTVPQDPSRPAGHQHHERTPTGFQPSVQRLPPFLFLLFWSQNNNRRLHMKIERTKFGLYRIFTEQMCKWQQPRKGRVASDLELHK